MSKKGGGGGISYADPPPIKDASEGLKLAHELLQLRLAMDRVTQRLAEMKIAERADTPFGALRSEIRYVAVSVNTRLGETLLQVRQLEAKSKGKDVAASGDGTKQGNVLRR